MTIPVSRPPGWLRLLGSAVMLLLPAALHAETVSVITPTFVTFSVSDVSTTTVASPSTATVSFSDGQLDSGRHLRVSVIADSANFTPPTDASIPASKVTWTISGSSGGNGYSGTLSDSTYSTVFDSVVDPVSGSVDIVFRLEGPGSGIRAGDHDLSLRWQFTSEP